eukprot:366441-Chlamydomonas_euryale.AAC.17
MASPPLLLSSRYAKSLNGPYCHCWAEAFRPKLPCVEWRLGGAMPRWSRLSPNCSTAAICLEATAASLGTTADGYLVNLGMTATWARPD